MSAIESFWGDYRFLSNFWPAVMAHEGYIYPTLEHAYQAAKTTVHEFRVAIQGCTSPGDAKRMGGQIPIRDDWESIKIDVMRELLREKFKNRHLRKLLLATGDAELIEGNNHGDYFWGVVSGFGQNWLGKLLMEVRNEYRT